MFQLYIIWQSLTLGEVNAVQDQGKDTDNVDEGGDDKLLKGIQERRAKSNVLWEGLATQAEQLQNEKEISKC